MEKIIEILEDLNPGVDYETSKRLIDDRILDSLTILALIAELEDVFDITIPAVEIVADNFNSVKSMQALITRLGEEELEEL